MYPLTKDRDLSFFAGADLLQVCVGRQELILNFHPDVRLTILSDLLVGGPEGGRIRYEEPTQAAVALFPLLHATVEKAEATDEGGLLLTFR